MTAARLHATALAIAFLAAACGSSAPATKDAVPPDGDTDVVTGGDDAGTAEAGADTAGADDAGAIDDAAEADAVDAGPDLVLRIAAGGPSRQIVSGAISLVGNGLDSCTNQTPAPGDRWCAFTKPATTLGFSELWVINITKVAAGTAITCDATDSNCLRLTSGLFSEQNADGSESFRIHGFDGDTLIYYAELGPTARTSFVGPVYAWRPGWASGHKLTSDTGVVCNGHPRAAVAICFEGLESTSVPGQLHVELHAGKIGPNDTGPLPLVDKALYALETDDQDLRKFQADLSGDGAWVGWSTRLQAMGPETLKAQKLDDNATRITVAEDVSRWSISPDQKKWYWLKKFNYDLNGAESGTLEMASFPAGDGVTPLVQAVGDYSTAGQKGLLVRSSMAQFVGKLELVADRDAPTALKTFDTGVLGVIEQSADGAKALYVKDIAFDGLTDLLVASSTASIPCSLSAETIAIPAGNFLAAGNLVPWARFNELTSTIEGLYTTVGDCLARKFAVNIAGWVPAGDETLVFLDDFALDGSDRATLRIAPVSNGTLPASGIMVVARDVASIYAQLVPALPVIVYAVQARTPNDGLYAYVGPP